jgi:uncharacterized HAD superfamily protein
MESKRKLVIAIDFDGTIVEHEFPIIGKLKNEAKRVINRISEKHEVIIWTCRSLTEHIDDLKCFLEINGINYTKINENSDCVSFGCVPKIYADLYIDDRALFFKDDWNHIENELIKIGVL